MKILILNGPNLNLLGRREPSVYGDRSFDEYFQVLQKRYAKHDLEYFQSNSEGEIISKIHQVGFDYDGIVLNAGAYTHTSIAIADAIRAVHTPVVELHISNVYAREEYRHRSMIAPACRGCICGFGLKGYDLAIESFLGDEAASKKPLGKKMAKGLRDRRGTSRQRRPFVGDRRKTQPNGSKNSPGKGLDGTDRRENVAKEEELTFYIW